MKSWMSFLMAVCAVLLMGIGISYAGDKIYYAKTNFPACLSESDYDLFSRLVSQNDYETTLEMVNDNRCILFKGNNKVSIIGNSSSHKVKIRFIDTPFVEAWTIREALE